MQRTGCVVGTFDLLDVGHVRLLTAAAAAVDRLVVGVAADALAARRHGATVVPVDERVALVEQVRGVDDVIVLAAWADALDLVPSLAADGGVLVLLRSRTRWAGTDPELVRLASAAGWRIEDLTAVVRSRSRPLRRHRAAARRGS